MNLKRRILLLTFATSFTTTLLQRGSYFFTHERLGFSPDVIEAQLAHSVRDNLGRAYNRTEFVDQRRKMLQAWADYLDKLRWGVSATQRSEAVRSKRARRSSSPLEPASH